MDEFEYCDALQMWDKAQNTAIDSPIHHDNRCLIPGHKTRATLTLGGVTTRTTNPIIVEHRHEKGYPA